MKKFLLAAVLGLGLAAGMAAPVSADWRGEAFFKRYGNVCVWSSQGQKIYIQPKSFAVYRDNSGKPYLQFNVGRLFPNGESFIEGYILYVEPKTLIRTRFTFYDKRNYQKAKQNVNVTYEIPGAMNEEITNTIYNAALQLAGV